jgi:hypothetical protein
MGACCEPSSPTRPPRAVRVRIRVTPADAQETSCLLPSTPASCGSPSAAHRSSTRPSCSSHPVGASASSAPTASASRRCCASPASCSPTAAWSRLAPANGNVGYLPQEPERADETVREHLDGAPVWPPRRRRSMRPPRRWRPATPKPAMRTATRSTAGWRSVRPTSTRASPRCGPTSACPNACSTNAARAQRWRGRTCRAWPHCCSPASTCSCSTSPPTTSTSTGSPGWRSSSSASAAGCVIVSHDRTFLQRTITHVVEIDEFSHRATRYAGGWEVYLHEREVARQQAWQAPTRSTTASGRRSPAARSASASGPRRACRRRRRSRPTTTRTSRRSRSTRASSWPARPPARTR